MTRIGGPAIGADALGVIATKLDDALSAVVTVLAQALQRRQPKPVPVAVVALDVIDLRCDRGDPARNAHLAKRLLLQLSSLTLAPA